jgi:hypothetical protein
LSRDYGVGILDAGSGCWRNLLASKIQYPASSIESGTGNCVWKHIPMASQRFNLQYMRCLILFIIAIGFVQCNQSKGENKSSQKQYTTYSDSLQQKTYAEIKEDIAAKRKKFATQYPVLTDTAQRLINEFWVHTVSHDLFNQWEGTPWDFNGIAREPGKGTIACGYFVNTLLQAMDCKINRVKLSICPSSEMMKSLVPHQKLKNLSYLSYANFNDTLGRWGNGVYIVGLDFHTGFIVHEGKDNWFIHSNYIGRKGVTKEAVLASEALRFSKTRWLISLTKDREFLEKWLRGI